MFKILASALLFLFCSSTALAVRNRTDIYVYGIQVLTFSIMLSLQLLLLEEPDSLNATTEMKETPLFFAVKNNYMDCAELLLRWGANSQVLNLRLGVIKPF